MSLLKKIVSWDYNFHLNKFSWKSTEEEILKRTLQSLSSTISVTIILPITMIACAYYLSSLQSKIEISLWKEGLIPVGVIMVCDYLLHTYLKSLDVRDLIGSKLNNDFRVNMIYLRSFLFFFFLVSMTFAIYVLKYT